MTPFPTDFKVGVIAPFECLKEGWGLIKDRFWLFVGMTLVAMLIGGAAPLILIGAMTCGEYLCLFAKMRGETVRFENLFKGFDYFLQGLIAALIQAIPSLVLIVPAYVFFIVFSIATLPRDRGAGLPILFFVMLMIFIVVVMIASVLIHSLFIFTYPLIVDRKLSGWEAVKLSIRAAWKNFSGVLGLTLLTAGLGIAGVLACYVGVLVVLPMSFAAYAVAYRRVFPEMPPNFGSPLPPPTSWAA